MQNKRKNKLIDGATVNICKGLGQREFQHHSFMHCAEGSFKCDTCDQECCKHCVYDAKEKNGMHKTCMSCETNLSKTKDDELNSEFTMKKILVKLVST